PGAPLPFSGSPAREPACGPARLPGRRAYEAARPSDPIVQDVRGDRARRFRAARHRHGQATLGVREGDVDRLCRAARLEDGARVVELVLAEVDPDRRDRYRDDGDSSDRLRGAGELLQVDGREGAGEG